MFTPGARGRCALVVLALMLALAAGCGKKKNVLLPDLRPETTVFVQFDPLTGNHDVNHIVHLYWSGTDTDGDVVAFEFRFVYPGELADTVTWHYTAQSDSAFSVYTPNDTQTPTFEVRAIDNSGLKDLSPAFQIFSFTNQAPTLRLTPRRLTDTTYASVTLTWTALDPDGDNGKMRFRVWLDGAGNAANPIITDKKTFTLPTSAFLQGGHLLSGLRTVTVQAVDDGGHLSTAATTTWYVRAPVGNADHGRLLLIDDVTGRLPSAFIFDSIYTNTAKRNLNPTNGPNPPFSILRLGFTQPFLSSEDVRQTFSLFDAVIWYRGSQSGISPLLQGYQGGIKSYLDADGRFMPEGFDIVSGYGSPGSLDADWVTTYMGSDSLHMAPLQAQTDSTASLSINSGKFLHCPPFDEIPGDTTITMRSTIITNGLRGFALRDTNDVVIWARKGNLSPANGLDIPIAISVPRNRSKPLGGRLIVTTFPLRSAWSPQFPGVPRLLAKLFKQMGLAQ